MRRLRLADDRHASRLGGRGLASSCPWWCSTAVACFLIAAALPVAARAVAGPRGAVIHVRWQTGVDLEARHRLESRFRLANGEQLDGTTWRYVLNDASRGNVRALISQPAVEDTHHVDRRTGSIAGSATRTPRPRPLILNGDVGVQAADVIAILVALFASLLMVAGRSGRVATPRAAMQLAERQVARGVDATATAAAPLSEWLSRGIPEVTAATAGAFRLVFGTAVIWFFVSHPENARSLDNTFNPLIEGNLHATVLQWMHGHPHVADAVSPWLLITGVAFTVGIFTRLTYSLFVLGAVAWLFLATMHDSTHPHSTLGLTLVALLPSRWGDAMSVDGWGRRSNHEPAGKRYGYSVWVPGLVFGIAFAAAAWTKLTRAPGWSDWILNGSVKYHFITDAHNAPVDWGLQLAGYPWLAVLASFGVVAAELSVITAAFSRSEWYRTLLGLAALGLLGGFWLFMGVFWPGWWILLLGFLPWRRLSPGFAAGAAAGRSAAVNLPTWTQVTMVMALIGQQIAFSILRIERSPMFTYYPMYSGTYANSAEFDAAMVPHYRIVVATDRGEVELSCDAPESLVEEFRTALQGSSDAAARVWLAVRGCSSDIGTARQVTLEGDRNVFDWERLMFKTTRAAVILGPIAANAPLSGSPRD